MQFDDAASVIADDVLTSAMTPIVPAPIQLTSGLTEHLKKQE
jgi:hypothetical protein